MVWTESYSGPTQLSCFYFFSPCVASGSSSKAEIHCPWLCVFEAENQSLAVITLTRGLHIICKAREVVSFLPPGLKGTWSVKSSILLF